MKAIVVALSAAALIGSGIVAGAALNETTGQTKPVMSEQSVGGVQLVGRTNVHSGGRTGGAANKRVGCGGCHGHAA